jgi:hypothetical protein
MDKIKITSKNQKGGITAHTVSNNDNFVFSNKTKEKKKSNAILIIGGIIAFLASLVTILQYFNISIF